MSSPSPVPDRLQKLQQMLGREPNDPFLLYGIGMEYKKLGDWARAVEHFDLALQRDRGYCYAYYQKGQTLESAGDPAAARLAYAEGIAAAARKVDAHAGEELQAALEALQAGQ